MIGLVLLKQVGRKMVLSYSDSLVTTPDPNGGVYGDWIRKKDKFNVTCVLCQSNVNIKEGEKALSKHSSSAKHKKSKESKANTATIGQMFAAQDAKCKENKTCEEKVRAFCLSDLIFTFLHFRSRYDARQDPTDLTKGYILFINNGLRTFTSSRIK